MNDKCRKTLDIDPMVVNKLTLMASIEGMKFKAYAEKILTEKAQLPIEIKMGGQQDNDQQVVNM